MTQRRASLFSSPLIAAAVTAVAAALAPACAAGGVSSESDCTEVASYAELTAFAKCTSCHASTRTGAARLAAPAGVDFDTYDAAVASASESLRELDEGSMPPAGAAALTDDELQQIVDWASCGTPQ